MVLAFDNIAEHKAAYNDELNNLISFALTEIGMSHRQLAKEICIDRSNLYTLRNGGRSLTGFQFALLMKALKNRGVNPDEVLERVLGKCDTLNLQSSQSSLLSSLLQRRKRSPIR